MSIHIDNIFICHWLKDLELKKKYTNKNTIFIYPHHYFNIKKSIHYNTILSNNFKDYNTLINTTKQKEHTEEKFKNLIQDLNIYKLINSIKMIYDFKLNSYKIIDGTHRFSIMKAKNIIKNFIELKYMNISFDDETITTLKNKLSNTTHQKTYNGWNNRTTYGYHSFNIFNFNVQGQRIPIKRFEIIKQFYDFTNKSVIDFGCNTGGMLLHIPEIKSGIGIDYDKKCINFANYFKDILKYNNELTFITQDLNNFSFEQLNNIKVDIIFLLSLGSWIKEWKKLYTESYHHADTILLETNNDKEGIPQLELFNNLNCNIQIISDKSMDDTTGNTNRKLYLITKKHTLS